MTSLDKKTGQKQVEYKQIWRERNTKMKGVTAFGLVHVYAA
jgi:hypothetical protein